MLVPFRVKDRRRRTVLKDCNNGSITALVIRLSGSERRNEVKRCTAKTMAACLDRRVALS